MEFDNPDKYKGFTISCTAQQLPSGKWTGNLAIEKDGLIRLRLSNVETCDSVKEVEQLIIALGRRHADRLTVESKS